MASTRRGRRVGVSSSCSSSCKNERGAAPKGDVGESRVAVQAGATWRAAEVCYNGRWLSRVEVAPSAGSPDEYVARWHRGGLSYSGPHHSDEVMLVDEEAPAAPPVDDDDDDDDEEVAETDDAIFDEETMAPSEGESPRGPLRDKTNRRNEDLPTKKRARTDDGPRDEAFCETCRVLLHDVSGLIGDIDELTA